MYRRQFIGLCGALAGIHTVGCKQRHKFQTLAISANPYFSMSGLYLARELGYFAGLGLEIEIQQIATSAQAIALAAGGSLDVVFTSTSSAMVNAIAKGARLRIVAGREMAAPDCSDISVLYGRREMFPNGLQDPRLLKGKRVAANIDSSLGGFGMDMILKHAGMTEKDFSLARMPRSEYISALLSGRMDAVFASDFLRRYSQVADRVVKGISLGDVLPNHQVSYILFGSNLLDRAPETGARFLSAYLRGAREFLAGKTPKFHDDLAAANGLDPAAARRACRNSCIADGQIDLASLRRFIQWSQAKGYSYRAVSAEQLVDMRFLELQKKENVRSRIYGPCILEALPGKMA